MFTGLVQGTGKIAGLNRSGVETRLNIQPGFVLHSLRQGESIAVNGVCLTVEDFTPDRLYVYASEKTLSVTNLGLLRPAAQVNLERALALGDRLGGHLVSGHVDCMARIENVEHTGESRIFTLSFPEEYGSQVIDKGSVALDGISLTITACGVDSLQVNIIPATWKETAVSCWKKGALVNMETDMIGKYVQKTIEPWMKGRATQEKKSGIDMDFLHRHGFQEKN